jgi:hypothetical protein
VKKYLCRVYASTGKSVKEFKMKAVRIFSVVLALTLLAVVAFPFAAKPVTAQASQTIMVTSPVQALMDAASGMPLLAPMSITAPLITLNVESASSDYACTLIKQSPKDYTKMKTRQYFDMQWTIQNSGNRIWYASAIPFKYIGGAKMQTHGDTFDLPGDVGRGNKVNLVVDMTAPKTQGIYSTLWGLYSGNRAFCRLTLTIGVSRR